jgi:lipoprotein-releasing system ATP-binding protein
MSSDVLLKTENLTRTYYQGGESLTVLHNADIEIRAGEIVALVGPSGSGKSTLLQMAGLLDKPTSGKIFFQGKEAAHLNDANRTALRRDFVGFVYQFHYLLPEFTALENVVIPQMIAGKSKKDAEIAGREVLDRLKLSHRLDHRPARLSGGEQQRVAIARALANSPRLLLADEPTGNLDPETSAGVFEMLIDLVRHSGVGAIIATHNMDLAEKMDRILELKGGRIISY